MTTHEETHGVRANQRAAIDLAIGGEREPVVDGEATFIRMGEVDNRETGVD